MLLRLANHSRSYTRIRVNATTNVNPSFFRDIVSVVCERTDDPPQCLETIRIPPYETQLEMIQQLTEIHRHIDTHEIEPFVAQLIFDQRLELLQQMLIVLQEYQLSVEHMQLLIHLV